MVLKRKYMKVLPRVGVALILLFFICIGVFVVFEKDSLSFLKREETLNPKILLSPSSPVDETGLPRYELQCSTLKNGHLRFEQTSLPIHRYQLFDFGVADINQDGLLDIFSSNCNFRPSILQNLGNFAFKNVTSDLRLDLLPEIPDFACSIAAPSITEAGLYIYYIWQNIHIYYITSSDISTKIEVEMHIPHLQAEVVDQKGDVATVQITEQKTKEDPGETRFKFSSEREGLTIVNVGRPSIPVQISVSEDLPLNKIHIGPGKTSPPQHSFTLNTFDRHTYTWTDINGDQKIDLFSGRGGLRGSPEYDFFRKRLKDQLFINKTSKFDNVYDSSGMENCGCGTRKACWVNIDNDDFQELFIVCAREESCRLFRKTTSDEKYVECANAYGLDIQGEQPVFWFDMNNDGYTDLLSFSNKKPAIYMNQNGTHFQKQIIEVKENIEYVPDFLAVCDFDNDGNMEFFFANKPDHKTFLMRHKGNTEFEWLVPKNFNLPDKSLWACWADLNNDGYDELLSIPQGIMMNNPQKKTFEETQILSMTHIPETQISDARVQCVDVNNDGKQDVMLGYRIKGNNSSEYGEWWYLSLFQNVSDTEENWVEVEFQGSKGNPYGFANKVLCKMSGGNAKLRIVGEGEHSRAHQGNFRLHFGLGTAQESPTFIITSFDGKTKEVSSLLLNQLNRWNF